MNTTQLDLSLFCGFCGPKYDLGAPFVIGAWEYASTMQMCIRIPTDKPPTTNRKLPPDVEKLFDGFSVPNAFGPNPVPTWDEKIETCHSCNGMNVQPDDWDEAADGIWGDEDDDCLDCGGFGRIVIGSCERLGGRLIRTPNAQKMRTLPGLRVSQSGLPSEWLRFVFDGGGQGLVCPVVRKD